MTAAPRIVPALADVTQEIAGPVPLHLLYAWAAGEQDERRATELLEPFRIAGTVVSSDTCGLSRMTKERDLLDVLALISGPKEILHAIGAAIGGRAIGQWVADNTETFYAGTIDPAAIVSSMWEARRRIDTELAIDVGVSVHRGTFYELGDSLYGLDAHIVESLAEHYAGPGEILVTGSVAERCEGAFAFDVRDIADLPDVDVRSLTAAPRIAAAPPACTPYPHPYPAEFFDAFLAFERAASKEALRRRIYDRYLRQRIVVFLSRARRPDASWNGAGLLDDLVANVLLDALVNGLDGVRDHIAGLGGGLGILTFEDPADAYEAACSLRRRFTANRLAVKIGLAGGLLLHFANRRGASGIAGSPVNVASKISEDAGVPGQINIAADVAHHLPSLAGTPFEVAVGGVVLRGISV